MYKPMQFFAGIFIACWAITAHAQLKPAVLTKMGLPKEDGYPRSMALLPDGGTVIVGFKMFDEANNPEMAYCNGYIILMNANGTKRKEIVIAKGQGGACSLAVALVDQRTSEVYAIGRTWMKGGRYASIDIGNEDGFIIKYDAQGNEMWVNVFKSEGYGGFWGGAFDENGNILVSGNEYQPYITREMLFSGEYKNVSSNTYLTLTTFTPDGEILNHKNVNLPYTSINGAMKMEPAGDGNYWVALLVEEQVAGNGMPLYLIKISGDGTLIYEKRFSGTRSTMIDDLLPLGNGNVIVTARTYCDESGETTRGAHMFYLDAQANLLWLRNFDSGPTDGPHMVITETKEGNLVGALFAPDMVPEFAAYPRTRCNLWLIKLTADGEDIWKRSVIALDWHQEPNDIIVVNGEIRMALTGITKAITMQFISMDMYYCAIKDF
jgi:hypothetical protein